MTIKEIKANLSLQEVFARYGWKVDKNNRMLCPFHPDKKPSMQVYWETGTVYCFSTNCPTHGHSMDVLELVARQENKDKPAAKRLCESWLHNKAIPPRPSKPKTCQKATPGVATGNGKERIAVLDKFYQASLEAFAHNKEAQAYAKKRCLEGVETGYLTADCFKQLNPEEEKTAFELGLLKKSGRGYRPKFHSCLVFALRGPAGQVVDVYLRSILDKAEYKHFYLSGRQQGLYPGYPDRESKKLILCESVIDAASLPNLPQTSVLAFYGSGGDTAEHWEAIGQLSNLDELIFFFDGDDAGRKAVHSYGEKLQTKYPSLNITKANCFEGEDVNSLKTQYQTQQNAQQNAQHEAVNILISLLNRRIGYRIDPKKISAHLVKQQQAKQPNGQGTAPKLDTRNPRWLYYQGQEGFFHIAGGVKKVLESLRISLHAQRADRQGVKHRETVDLYGAKQVQSYARAAAEKLDVRADLLELDLQHLTDSLEAYRNQLVAETVRAQETKESKRKAVKVPPQEEKKAKSFLSAPRLLERLNANIGLTGMVGEEMARLFLLVIACSYKQKNPLHAIVHGPSGSGKTHLIEKATAFIPPEDTKSLTSASNMSFYHYGETEISHMFFKFQDLEGLPEEVQFAIREMRTYLKITRPGTYQDESGELLVREKTVLGPIASTGATTRDELNEDDNNRCFDLLTDDSDEQTARIIGQIQLEAKGGFDKKKAREVIAFMQNCVRLLKPYEVHNPYAGQVQIPSYVRTLRRMSGMFKAVVGQVTAMHQYQREKDAEGRLITEKSDVRWAVDLMFDSLAFKVDELHGGLRDFFEKLKGHVSKKGNRHYAFRLREIRQALHLPKSSTDLHIQKLLEMEYVCREGHANRGYVYKISYWDSLEAIRERIRKDMYRQLEQLE